MFVPCLCRFFFLSFEGVRGLNFSLFRGDWRRVGKGSVHRVFLCLCCWVVGLITIYCHIVVNRWGCYSAGYDGKFSLRYVITSSCSFRLSSFNCFCCCSCCLNFSSCCCLELSLRLSGLLRLWRCVPLCSCLFTLHFCIITLQVENSITCWQYCLWYSCFLPLFIRNYSFAFSRSSSRCFSLYLRLFPRHILHWVLPSLYPSNGWKVLHFEHCFFSVIPYLYSCGGYVFNFRWF